MEKVLGRKNIGADDNFFELGGDSLTALQVMALLKTVLGREVPIVTFYEAPTVAVLARRSPPRGKSGEGSGRGGRAASGDPPRHDAAASPARTQVALDEREHEA